MAETRPTNRGVQALQQPWEQGWQPADGPAPQSAHVETKVTGEATYHLWKNADGIETIQKNNAQYFRVSPGAFATIPSAERLGSHHNMAGPKHQT
jgi:hypothetical protein